MGLIYRALFPNGKSYIGMTSRALERRIFEHSYNASKRLVNNKFYNAIIKYGKDSIKWEILEDNLSDKDLVILEPSYIQHYNTYDNGYNSTLGGDNFPAKDPKVREKMKRNHKRPWLGRTHTEETKAKMRLNNKRTNAKLTSEDYDQIREKYKTGITTTVLMGQYKVCRQTIWNVLKAGY